MGLSLRKMEKLTKKHEGKIVEIEWRDAQTIHDIAYPKEELAEFKLLKATSRGMLVSVFRDRILLNSFNFTGETGDKYYKTTHIIPRCQIKRIFILEKDEELEP
jgi:hypothetical protein